MNIGSKQRFSEIYPYLCSHDYLVWSFVLTGYSGFRLFGTLIYLKKICFLMLPTFAWAIHLCNKKDMSPYVVFHNLIWKFSVFDEFFLADERIRLVLNIKLK